MQIALVYDLIDDYLAEGFSPEQAAEFDALSTILGIEGALADLGHEVKRVGNGRHLAAGLVAGERWDLVFNIAEGVRGRSREAQVPALLELFDIPYTFSDPLVCAVTLDKGLTKRILRDAGIATPPFSVVSSAGELPDGSLEFPLFVKPLCEGTSKGIDARSKVTDGRSLEATCLELLERYRQPILVEEYLPGREFTAGVLGSDDRAKVVGVMEVMIREESPVADYTYQVKCDWERLVRYEPLPASPLRAAIEELALTAYRVLGCRDASRIDVRLDRHGAPSFIEINPLPGLNPVYSDLPLLAAQEGLTYTGLIGAIVESAWERCTRKAEVSL